MKFLKWYTVAMVSLAMLGLVIDTLSGTYAKYPEVISMNLWCMVLYAPVVFFVWKVALKKE